MAEFAAADESSILAFRADEYGSAVHQRSFQEDGRAIEKSEHKAEIYAYSGILGCKTRKCFDCTMQASMPEMSIRLRNENSVPQYRVLVTSQQERNRNVSAQISRFGAENHRDCEAEKEGRKRTGKRQI